MGGWALDVRARGRCAADPVWSRLGAGCHLDRETQDAIVAAGFQVERSDRLRFRMGAIESIAETHILGTARRPSASAPA